jgi:carboxymethylenebutenolidase
MTTSICEDDQSIITQWIDIERDGGKMRAYYAVPRTSTQATPTILMTMHLTGVDAGQRAGARRLAKEGFATLVPDLYARFDAPNPDEVTDMQAFVPFAKMLSKETTDPDIRASADRLRKDFPKSKTAILGFCMGGIIALHRTAGYSDVFTAAAVWYGHPDAAGVDPEHVDIPIVASYGESDAHIPFERVNAFFERIRVPRDLKIYPNAGHAFCDDTRPTYNPEAAADSGLRAIAFLRERLR